MERSENGQSAFKDVSNKMMERAGRSSRTALVVAGHRYDESMLPEGERICYDPYAVHFIAPEMLALYKDPVRLQAVREHMERLVPGMGNSIRARTRYFDDFVKRSIAEGLEQLVILGAGYDTRPYRIEGIEKVRVFEVDHPDTQCVKTGKIKEIFGRLPDHVSYVPADLAAEDLGQGLRAKGYDISRRTLFLMEGLVYYLPPRVLDDILSFIVKNSGRGSSVLFDYFFQSVVDGTHEEGRGMKQLARCVGEPLLFGIEEGSAEAFLAERGFSRARNVTTGDCRKAFFHGANEDRVLFRLNNFVHAVVD